MDPNEAYIFSAWIVNIYRCHLGKRPFFKVSIKSKNRARAVMTLFEYDLDAHFPVTIIPTWRQIGAVIDFSNAEGLEEFLNDDGTITITADFLSTYDGPIDVENINGNDIGIDDIKFRLYTKTVKGATISKAVDKEEVSAHEDFEYTVVLSNDTMSYISDCIFIDPLPAGTILSPATFSLSVSDLYLPSESISEEELAVGKNISEIIASKVSANDPHYSDLSAGRLPSGLKITIKYKIQVDKLNELRFADHVYNKARFDYNSGVDEANGVDISRTVISNEVKTRVIYPVLNIKKEVYRYANPNEIDISDSKYVMCGDDIVYNLIIDNTGTDEVTEAYVEDELNPILWPLNGEEIAPENWAGSISKQIVLPDAGNAEYLTENDIEIIDSNRNSLKLKNLSIPAGGRCIVKIYCKVVCNENGDK